ncbi:Cycloeucalenol cycloisomerase [Fusarium sp. LHS14.1]|nr:Cycloeucalenol cycloisomerase [Fusarium sp. LHS14.1]
MTQPSKRTIPPRQSLEDEKLWTERVILAQSPFWIIAVALVISTGVPRHWNDIEYLLFSTTVAAPSVVLPALLSSRRDLNHRPWSHRYWLKLNVWVAVVVCFGTYFGSHYFFDAVGLRYIFNVDWNFSWVVVGRSRQEVPVFMYPLTHAYFMTYFTSMMAVERKIVRRLQLGWIGRQALVPVLSYGLAFAEIFVMASPLLSGLSTYKNRKRMLGVYSLGYTSYFTIGLPRVRRIDSDQDWSLVRVLLEALGSCMAILVVF